MSESAVKQRMDEISGAARSMTLSDDLEKTQSERVNIFYEFVKVQYRHLLLEGSDVTTYWLCEILFYPFT